MAMPVQKPTVITEMPGPNSVNLDEQRAGTGWSVDGELR
jgi:hypothetical protein